MKYWCAFALPWVHSSDLNRNLWCLTWDLTKRSRDLQVWWIIFAHCWRPVWKSAKFSFKSLPNEATLLGTDETSSRSQAWTMRANDGHGVSVWFCVQAQQRLAWSSLEPKVLGLVNGFQDLRHQKVPPKKVEIEFRDEIFEIRKDPN